MLWDNEVDSVADVTSNIEITQVLLRVRQEYEALTTRPDASQESFQWLNATEAQRLMDHLQLVLDRVEVTREQSNYVVFLKILRFLSRKYQTLPSSLIIRDVVRDGSNPLAGGGFADIWRGSIGLTHNLVCIKVLRLTIEQDEDQRDMIRKQFLHEALIWRQLKHPNVLPLLGVSSELFFPSFCLISPWMANSNIMAYLKRNPQHNLSQTFLDISSGLNYLHSRSPPIIHGDIRGVSVFDDRGQDIYKF
ncbi:hypothetical protein GYMLUDRAFT_228459 [Collybiopsis luxurians FD-317 M1]|uniref:Protein kinase domain-containing protein n=1 Tax=Collybiopsis luxurians FD-317 M1 TaxID=944289 RepID=A0A0D0B3P5_9AGAR|nr:hypothetical protein GYMLUDRAFT_228459 [Collybiopsis luxurians FD-317 M1]